MIHINSCITELISKKEQDILVYSLIKHNYNLKQIPNSLFASKCEELSNLIKSNPEIFKYSAYYEQFVDFNEETNYSFTLPLDNINLNTLSEQQKNNNTIWYD